ncbi:uncharacterized protein LOC135490014 [Lineus longissimus]|uniref:uncharacterized protein LOC135490014 n=1 Tax=Lineus longissimus TaxID=88925 RepID=UPI00315C7A1E
MEKEASSDQTKKKQCLSIATKDCTNEQIARMNSHFSALENNVLVTCKDRFYSIMKDNETRPAGCNPKKATDLLNKYLEFEYKVLLTRTTSGKPSQGACKKFEDILKYIEPMVEPCKEVTKARVAQALTYPRAIFNSSCSSLKWPKWKTLMELDFCQVSDNYELLQNYTRTLNNIMPDKTYDWTTICSKYAPDMATILKNTSMCNATQMATITKMGKATQKALAAKCAATNQRPLTEPSTCNVKEAAAELSNALHNVTHDLVNERNKDKLCM